MVAVSRLVALSLCILAACKPDLVESAPQVTEPRLLALRSEPAEAAPGQAVSLTALYADGSGALTDAPLDWALCVDRKPLAELGPVSPRCLAPSSDILIALGVGVAASGTMPKDACRNFGPERPDPKPGEPAGRPVDPDQSGGFYQPLRVRAHLATGDTYTVFGVRIACSLSGATQEQRAQFETSYVRNTNPSVASFVRVAAGHDDALPPLSAAGAEGLTVQAGATMTLRAAWAPCAGIGVCTGSEQYVAFDTASRALVSRRESIAVAWLATAGAFAEPSTGRSEAEGAVASSDNVFTAPSVPGDITLWAVLRDDRGGVGWETYRVHVIP